MTSTSGARRRGKRLAKRDLSDLSGARVGLYCRVSDDEDEKEKSVSEQETAGREWVSRQKAILTGIYSDNNISASRFTTKEREEFIRLIGDIEAGKLDVVWFWELSRSQRKLDVFAKLRDSCRDLGVLWCVAGRVYDLGNYMDATALGLFAVIGENESEMTSERVARGVEGAAMGGKPHGRWNYGYRRRYTVHPGTGKTAIDRIEPDIFDGDGPALAAGSPAAIVRELFGRVEAGESYNTIVRDLNARGVPTPGMVRHQRMNGDSDYPADLRFSATPSERRRSRPPRWSAASVHAIISNPAYIGRRVHQGQDLITEGVTAMWPPLIEESQFWNVQRIRKDRRNASPSRWRATAAHLLSGLATCGTCGSIMYAGRNKPRPGYGYEPLWVYGCREKFCVAIRETVLDEYVEKAVVAWLSRPDVFSEVTRVDDSAAAAQARAESDELRLDLEEWREQAEAGEVSAVTFARVEKDRLARIAAAEARAQSATVPPVLLGNIGGQAAALWAQRDLQMKRAIIRSIVDIRVMPVGKGRRVPVRDRIKLTPLIGPGFEDAGQDS
jgi:DNA invertase Pin-like site-specific DNA recombinase